MKTQLTALAIAALVSQSVLAGNVSKWTGTGVEYSPDGQQLGTYQVSVENTELAQNTIQSETTITMADGSQKTISQKIVSNGNNWSVVSNLGKGGGTCYGTDICENYISGENGLAYATTIVGDGKDSRRDVTFVLQDGKATKVLRETLTRAN